MEIIKDINQIQWNKTSVTLGKFDGVHLGHQLLIDRVMKAEAEGCTSTVFTFDRFPSQVLLHQKMTSILLEEEKQRLLKSLGIQRYVLFPFHEQTASMEPEEFVEEILVKTMKVKHLYVGTDFRFGKGRMGDPSTMKQLMEQNGGSCVILPQIEVNDKKISSSYIRRILGEGKLEEVETLLGRKYSFILPVREGRQFGRKIGCPTINQIPPADRMLPRFGVYESTVHFGNEVYTGITNVGIKPTVSSESKPIFETHIPDFSGDLYGVTVKVTLNRFLRKERCFASVDELKAQIEKDILTVRKGKTV